MTEREDRVGQQLGSYRLVRLLGKGGFAEVYLAEHTNRKSMAAVKVLHTRFAKDNFKDFLNEASSYRLWHRDDGTKLALPEPPGQGGYHNLHGTRTDTGQAAPSKRPVLAGDCSL